MCAHLTWAPAHKACSAPSARFFTETARASGRSWFPAAMRAMPGVRYASRRCRTATKSLRRPPSHSAHERISPLVDAGKQILDESLQRGRIALEIVDALLEQRAALAPQRGPGKLMVLTTKLRVAERMVGISARLRRLGGERAPVDERYAYACPALIREALRECTFLVQRHRTQQPRDARIRDPRRIDFGGPEASEHQRGGNGKRQAVLSILGGRGTRALRTERDRLAKAVDGERRDLGRREAVCTLQRERRLDRGLGPAAHGIRLEILLEYPPARAEIAPELAHAAALDGDCGRTGEARTREHRRAHARVRAPSRAVLEHRGRVADAQDLTARAQILGDAQRVARSLVIESEKTSAQRSARQRVPRAGAVIVVDARVERDTRARGDLVAQDETRQKLARIDRARSTAVE